MAFLPFCNQFFHLISLFTALDGAGASVFYLGGRCPLPVSVNANTM
jgi:hypothetical protein